MSDMYLGVGTLSGEVLLEPQDERYARVLVKDSFWDESDRVCTNTRELRFVEATINWGVITHIGLFDAKEGGNARRLGKLGSSRNIEWEDTIYFAPGDIRYTPTEYKPMDTYIKQPSEKEYIAIELASRLATGDTLSSITECKCYDSAGTDVTSTLIDTPVIDGTDVNMWIQAGTDGKTYNITLKVHTTQGADLEEDLIVIVREYRHA